MLAHRGRTGGEMRPSWCVPGVERTRIFKKGERIMLRIQIESMGSEKAKRPRKLGVQRNKT